MFVLDTDHITILQGKAQPEYGRLVSRMMRHPRSAFYYSIVNFQEQVLGANQYVNQARTVQGLMDGYDLLVMILADYAQAQVLPFDAAVAAHLNALRAQRVRIGTMDLRIAAIALSRNMTVLTRNVRDFRKVPGLVVEDWTI
jgi:tRNA(fMet)-specific endonuclease VapC